MIGRRLKIARLASGFTFQQLSEKTKISTNDLLRFECDNVFPSSLELLSLTKALKIRVDFLLPPRECESAN